MPNLLGRKLTEFTLSCNFYFQVHETVLTACVPQLESKCKHTKCEIEGYDQPTVRMALNCFYDYTELNKLKRTYDEFAELDRFINEFDIEFLRVRTLIFTKESHFWAFRSTSTDGF